MWKALAILTICIGIFGCFAVEDPQREMQYLIATVNSAYQYSKERIQTNPAQTTAIATPVITTIIWIGLFLFLRNRSYRYYQGHLATQKNTEENQKKPNQSLLERAQAQILYEKLKQDLVILEGRYKWLPETIMKVRRDLEDAQIKHIDANNALVLAERNLKKTEDKLKDLLNEQEKQNEEIKQINQELERLKNLI